MACNTSFCLLARSFNALSYEIPTCLPLPLFPFLCQSVLLLGPCLNLYPLTKYLQIPAPRCIYYSSFYKLQKYLLPDSFTFHVQAHNWQGTCSDNTVISQLIFYCVLIICLLFRCFSCARKINKMCMQNSVVPKGPKI